MGITTKEKPKTQRAQSAAKLKERNRFSWLNSQNEETQNLTPAQKSIKDEQKQ